MANINISKENETRYKAKVSITAEEQKSAEKRAISKVQQKKSVAGFRKGKVPPHIIKSKFSAEVLDETLQATLHEQLPKIADQSEKGFYQIVKIENLKVKPDSMAYELVFDTNPHVKLGKMKNISVNEDKPEITSKDIDEELARLQERYAEFSAKDNGLAEEGDKLKADIEIWINDVPQGEPMKGREFFLKEKGFDEDIIKALKTEPRKVNDEITVKKKLSEKEHSDLKEKNNDPNYPQEYDIIVKLQEIQKVSLPALDDEFAKKVDEKFESLEKLKDDIRGNLEKEFHRKNFDAQIKTAIDSIVNEAEIFWPESYIHDKMHSYVEERKVDLHSLPEEHQKELEKSITDYEQRKIVIDHLINDAVKIEQKKEKENDYRDQFKDFLKGEYGEISEALIGIYDAVVAGQKIDQGSTSILERGLGLFHQNLLEKFFRKQGLVKKGKKIPVFDILKNG